MNKNKIIALGIGNPHLQDDRAGIEVVRRLAGMNLHLDTCELHTVDFELMERLAGYERAFVIDACRLGKRPGEVIRVSLDDIYSPSIPPNSHSITLGAALKTGYSLFPEQMPPHLSILLIEIERAEKVTSVMSPQVEEGVRQAVQIIVSELKISENPSVVC